MTKKIPVAILGATGLVGQKAIALLEGHEQLFVQELVASEERSGRLYGEEVVWKEPRGLSERVAKIPLKRIGELESKYVISALPADVAKEVEPNLVSRGCFVSSNASAYRMAKDVPILIPEINLAHMELLKRQKGPGRLVTNSNCTTAFIALALKPLTELGVIEHVSVMTMQAISGAGSYGVDSLDILGNIIPYIKGEEEKILQEVRKILGDVDRPADFDMTIHVHRVPVLHGHTAVLHVRFRESVDLQQVLLAYPEGLYHLHRAIDRPQPAKDVGPYDHSVHIGRIKVGTDPRHLGLIAMGNNLVRGAAGASLQNLEALIKHG